MNAIANIRHWFETAMPAPTAANLRVQVGVHLEEVGEMLTALGFKKEAALIDDLATEMKGPNPRKLEEVDRVELLDSLCDQIVTAVGVAYILGMDIDGALNEVNRSNWSKFDEDSQPIFDANGKVVKGPNYSAPDLEPYV